MGFNIGVSAMTNINEEIHYCDKFLERKFYTWVAEFQNYGDQACIIQTGKYFNLDLKPLTKMVYANSEVDDDFIQRMLQPTEFLIDLVNKLIEKVINNINFIDSIEYQIDKGPSEELRKLMVKNFKKNLFPRDKNPNLNPWRKYIKEGEFIEHLITLKESLTCFQSKGYSKVYLTAG